MYQPQKINFILLNRHKASNWILNYCACLHSIKKEDVKEKKKVFLLINFIVNLLLRFEKRKAMRKRGIFEEIKNIFYDVKYGIDNLIKALGQLNYLPATDLFLNGLQNHAIFRSTKFDELKYFNFQLTHLNTLIALYLSTPNAFAELKIADRISYLISKDTDFVSDTILNRITVSTDDTTRKKLIELTLRSYFEKPNYALSQGKILAFLVEELVYEIDSKLQWTICNKLAFLAYRSSFIKNSKAYSEHTENLFNKLNSAILQQTDKRVKNNAVKAIGLYLIHFHHGATPDNRFESLFVSATEDDNPEILANCLYFNGKYKFQIIENEHKYFDRVYEIYDSFPSLRHFVIETIGRAKSNLTKKDTEMATNILSAINRDYESNDLKEKLCAALDVSIENVEVLIKVIKEMHQLELNAAFDIIISRNIFDAKIVLESIIESKQCNDYLVCRSIEAMIYLDPALYSNGYKAELTAHYNALLKTTLEVEKLEHLVEQRLRFVGNAETIKLLDDIRIKYDEDRHTISLKKQYRTQPLYFIHTDTKKEKDLWRFIFDCVCNIERKLKVMEANCNGDIEASSMKI